MREIVLPKKALRLWQTRLSLITLCLCALLLRFYFATRWMLLPVSVLAAALAVLLFWYLPRYFDSFRLILQQDAIVVKKGVIFRSTIIMPSLKLVYISSVSSPLARKLGLSGLILRAVRGFTFIPEIPISEAQIIIASHAGENE